MAKKKDKESDSIKVEAEARPQKAKKATRKKKEEVPVVKATEETAHRPPQLVTVNGDKVSHGHVFQSKDNPENWYFTAKINGQPLKPQLVSADDLADFRARNLDIRDMMNLYFPTKMLPKVSSEAFSFPIKLEGPSGNIELQKFNIYKETDETKPEYGKYKFFARVDGRNMSAVASPAETSAYFDRVLEPVNFVRDKFGEQLHLKSYYEKFRLPEGVNGSDLKVEVGRQPNEKPYFIQVEMSDGQKTSRKQLGYDDAMSLYGDKTATKEQLASKYFFGEIKAMAPEIRKEQHQGLKM